MVRPFVILANQRTGSNMLALGLDSHPNAKCFGEIFRKKCPQWRMPDIQGKPNPGYFVDYLNDLINCYEDWGAVGFKFMYGHSPKVRNWFIGDPTWAIIHLYRDNLLAQYAAWKNAKKTQKGVNYREQGEFERLYFDSTEFEQYCESMKKRREPVEERLKDSAGGKFEVSYEDLTIYGLGPIELFLGLDPGLCQVPTSKRQSSNVLERFSNSDKVEYYLEKIGRPQWAFEQSEELK